MPSGMGKRRSRNSAGDTAIPPRAANSHSTSVGRRTKPGAPSSFGNFAAAFFCSHRLYLSEKFIASNQLMPVCGRRIFAAGVGHFFAVIRSEEHTSEIQSQAK